MKAFDAEKFWYVVRTNIKCEAKAATNINLAGFGVYFARQRFETMNKRTKTYMVRERPLMIGYLFVGLPKDSKHHHFGFVRACEGVEGFLGVNGTPIRVPSKQVESIYLAELDMQFDETRAARIHRKEEAKTKKLTIEMAFQKGERKRIKDGPFAAFFATVEEVTTQGQVDALVSIFGRMTTVRFDPSQLEAA